MNTFCRRVALSTSAAAIVVAGLTTGAAPASATSPDDLILTSVARTTAAKQTPARFQNCTNLRKKWPHGLGRRHAHDKTSGDPVTNFKRSNKLFRKAMGYNRGLDRDKDKIACEQH